MNNFETMLLVAIFMALLAGVYALIYKGSRPPQSVAEHPTPPMKAAVAAVISFLCAAISYGIFRGLDLYLRDHLAVRSPLSTGIILIGLIAPWGVGIYFAHRAARTANKTLRAIGSMEVMVFLLGLAVPFIAQG